MPDPERLKIAQVTPFAWKGADGSDGAVNRQIARTSELLVARGHEVVVITSSADERLVRASRKRIRAGEVFDPSGALRVIAAGETVTGAASSRRPALPLDVARTIEELFALEQIDICHVHEPFAPSMSSAALRHSRALTAGTFHSPAERLVSTQVARRVVQLVFGRLDLRLTSFAATAELMQRFFPAEYRVLTPGADVVAPAGAPGGRGADDGDTVKIAFVDVEERGALRLFLRGLRRLDLELDWEAVIYSPLGPSSSIPLREDVRERVRWVDHEDDALVGADVIVSASDGADAAPITLLRGLACGAVPLASDLPVYAEVVADGEHGLLFPPRDPESLAAQLARLVGDRALRVRLRDAAAPLRERLSFERLTDELEVAYTELAARRHDPVGNPALWRRIAQRKTIDVDLHMHTDHSHDCATPVEVLLATARDQGLGAIAVTDHNEVSGALEAQAKAADFGVKIIVAEEVKTASQGEVIGLFLTEKIPRGLTLEETVAEIRRQGGLVYVPHPFDRMHAVPDYEHLLRILDDVDALEVYNPRVAIGSFNEEAARFAAKYRIVAGAGSDSHVAQGLGSVRIRMHDFDGPEEFLESLRHAEIHTKPGTLLYVQALKFLETKATPAAARRARRERRVRRATRKP